MFTSLPQVRDFRPDLAGFGSGCMLGLILIFFGLKKWRNLQRTLQQLRTALDAVAPAEAEKLAA